MSKVEFHYDRLMDDAVRGVIARVLGDVADRGLPGQHHFFIGFRTDHPGVEIAPALRESHPREMTIALQHQFWDLNVADDRFSVTLSFNKVPQRLVVPYAAITGFADPSVRWGIKLQARDVAPLPEQARPAEPKDQVREPARPAAKPHVETVDSEREEPAKVVTLESFRRK